MSYISVVPAIRTPFGVDVFDYRLADSGDVRVGDLVRVPFRNRPTPALVVSVSPDSAFASRAIEVRDLTPLVRFPATLVPLLDRSAIRVFASRPTVLHSWLRTVPKRPPPLEIATRHGQALLPSDASEWTADRIASVVRHVRAADGRVLVLCPWRQRAEYLARILGAPVLHADLADGAAWKTWTAFASRTDGILVATRIGAWLAALADAVVIEEPENDDYKSDELAPRLDARWIVKTANAYRPSLSVIRIGTTPPLTCEHDLVKDVAPDIPIDATYVRFHTKGTSEIDGLSSESFDAIGDALEEKRPIVILHPIRGEWSRVACRDCGWSAACPNCGFPVTRTAIGTRCGRCGKTGEVFSTCPSCGGADLGKGRAGRDRLATDVRRRFGDGIRVMNLSDWNALSPEPRSLAVVTDASLIGGTVEDVRRRERLVIAWRRLAASVASIEGRLVVQGPEELLQEARAWLTSAGVRRAWQVECRERTAFGYPPARPLIKLLKDGPMKDAQATVSGLRNAIPSSWEIRGPFPVPYRPRSRQERSVIQLLPPSDATEDDFRLALEPFAREAIIDLDPIAFLG